MNKLSLKDFIRTESFGGFLLLFAAIFAMVAENSPLQPLYANLLSTPVEFRIGGFEIAKPLLLWINDGLMAVFFFLIGLEIKREVLVGELSEPSRLVLPIAAAIGGMAMPAIIYAWINWGDPDAMRGWAIPSATDIAFALGVLAFLKTRVPNSLKLFLMTLAIADDIGAIIIIALFYSSDLSIVSISIAGACIVTLFAMNRFKVIQLSAYLMVGLIFWTAVLKSGVHATLAGVITALFIPYRKPEGEEHTLLERLEHDLHPLVAFAILPIFAFANTGVSLDGVTMASVFHPVPLGIAAGLFFGNQIGVFGISWIMIKAGLAELPRNATWLQIYGVSMLCGIGFTMSLFISSLAFVNASEGFAIDDRIGILIGSFAAGIGGYLVLRFGSKKQERDEKADPYSYK